MKDNNREAADSSLCKELYEERIKTLEEYNRALEADLQLLKMEVAADGE